MYFNTICADVEQINDIRVQEVKKLLGLFPSNCLIYLDQYNNLYGISDNTILYCINLNMNNSPYINYDLAFNLESYDKENADYLINDKYVLYYMRQRLSEYNASIGEVLYYKEHLEEDEQFAELLKLKAGDGLKFYKALDDQLNKIYAVPVFSRFPSLNKGDTISITLSKDLSDLNKIIYTMSIYKKKYSRMLNISCKLLNII